MSKTSQVDELSRLRDLYLTLMQACLTGTIYKDRPLKSMIEDKIGDTSIWRIFNRISHTLGYHSRTHKKREEDGPAACGGKRAQLSESRSFPDEPEFDPLIREYGWDWPSYAHTMIGVKRLANVRALVESVIGNSVPGDLIETGVWRGGACIMMRAVLQAYRVSDRRVWVADSFEGMPSPDLENFPQDKNMVFHKYSDLVVPIEEVRRNFEKYGLLDERVVFLKGWFKDTLPKASIERLSLIRLDGDMYESTLIPLNVLYDKLSVGGYVIVDDYHVVKPCKRAVQDFCRSRGFSPQIEEIDGVGIFWRKTGD